MRKNNNLHFENIAVTLCQFYFNDLDFEKTRRTQLCLQFQKVCFKNSPKIVTFGEQRLVISLFFFSQLF